MVKVSINGIENLALMDTGASKAICSTESAKILCLKTLNSIKTFSGLGKVKGTLTEAVKVKVGEREISVQFHIVEIPISIILGVEELTKLKVVVHPKTGQLKDEENLEVVAVAQTETDQQNQEKSSITEEHYENSKSISVDNTLLQEITNHLELPMKNKVIKIFLNYKSCWEHPKSGKAVK
eukprot:GHVL01036714.1.p1 GENE.GHVL01036714.1~~GHVL01036714.1.p1  ORF type:complete len:181 (-),score=27.95 GHVL01036714.1:701-1243(-)